MNPKIAIIASSIHTEKQAHLLEWYDDLSKSNLSCKLFVGSKTTAIPKATNFKLNSKWDKVKYLFKGKKAHKNQPLLDYNPKTIHLLTSNTYESIKSSLNVNTKLIVSYRGFDINVFPFLSEENLKSTLKVFKRADVLHFISNGLRDKAIDIGADPSKTIVIKRSLNIEKLSKSITRNTVKDKILILSVCRLVWEKGLTYALEAMGKLINLNNNIEYVIIGDGIDKNLLSYHIKRLKIEDNVILLGALPKEQVFTYYQKASIYLQPSLEEALSNSIMEASYFGLPVVATMTGGIPEVVKHGYTGLLAPVANSQILFEYLLKLVEDESLRLRCGQNGHLKMKEEFNRRNEIRSWLHLYNS